MKQEDLCQGNCGVTAVVTDTPMGSHPYWEEVWGKNCSEHQPRPKGVKRIRLTCPKCKRRVMSSIRTCYDGCCTYHYIPPHKPKHWWKRKKLRRNT